MGYYPRDPALKGRLARVTYISTVPREQITPVATLPGENPPPPSSWMRHLAKTGRTQRSPVGARADAGPMQEKDTDAG